MCIKYISYNSCKAKSITTILFIVFMKMLNKSKNTAFNWLLDSR